MIKLIRFILFVVIILTSAILWFKYNSDWGTAIVLGGLVIDFCLYTYSLSCDVDGDITEDKRFKGSLVGYGLAFVVILAYMWY